MNKYLNILPFCLNACISSFHILIINRVESFPRKQQLFYLKNTSLELQR